MNKYEAAAIRAVELIDMQRATTPQQAWEAATTEVFGIGTSSQAKECPKNTFLALCETGRVKGVKSGSYTKSKKNKSYAMKALELLSAEPSFSGTPVFFGKQYWGKSPKGTTPK